MVKDTGVRKHLKAALHDLMSRFDAVGLRIERGQCPNHHRERSPGRAEGQREIDNLKRIGELLAGAEVPIYGIQAFESTQLAERGRDGWSAEGAIWPHTRAFIMNESAAANRGRVTADQLWKGLISIYKRVIPVSRGSGRGSPCARQRPAAV
jgi:hypothetical protein